MVFSVIVPIYNVKIYLHKCIDSVLSQTYTDFELILVDDGSTDGCAQIIDGYTATDPRIRVIHKPNGGLVSARKAGLGVASGDYIVVLDGDDWIAENMLERIAEAIQENQTDMVCFGHFAASEQVCQRVLVTDRNLVYHKEDIERDLLPTLLLDCRSELIKPNLWGKAFRRQLYEAYQSMIDDRITMGEDGVVVYPCVCRAESICFLPDALYYYRSNPTSMTRSPQKLISWEGALLRIAHLKISLPLEKYTMRKQLGCYASHAIFNVILTQIASQNYTETKKEALERLGSGDLMELIQSAEYSGSFPEKLAQVTLRHRWIWLVKLYSMIR